MKALLAAAFPRSPAAGRRWWPFRPSVNVAGIILLAGSLATLAIFQAEERHRERIALQAACAEAARVLIAHKSILAQTVRLADACAYVRRLQGNEP